MARPRKLGPTISFRLPIELHAIADERAQAKGMAVNDYLAARITDALSRQRDGDPATSGPPSPVSQPADIYSRAKVTPRWKASMKP